MEPLEESNSGSIHNILILRIERVLGNSHGSPCVVKGEQDPSQATSLSFRQDAEMGRKPPPDGNSDTAFDTHHVTDVRYPEPCHPRPCYPASLKIPSAFRPSIPPHFSVTLILRGLGTAD